MAAPPLAVDKEKVRMLVLECGPREAARRMGLKEDTVNQWSKRGGWLKHLRPENQPKPPSSMQPIIVPNVISPADALSNLLAENHGKTKVGLSQWTAETGGQLGTLKGEKAMAAHPVAVSVASVMTKIWPEQAQPSVRISMFAPGQVIDIEAQVVEREGDGAISASGEHRGEAEVADSQS